MSVSRVNALNMLLAVLSVVAAFLLPFEVFLFSYAVLGPLHYLTQISWMHDRHYFTASVGRGDALGLGALAVLSIAIQLFIPAAAPYGPSITFVAFGIAALMIFLKDARTIVIGAAILVGLSLVAQRWEYFALTFGGFLPTVIHVCVFTACFVLVGALKTRDWSGIGLLGVYTLCAATCFLWTPDTGYAISEAARQRYTQEFYGLNASLALVFSSHPFADLQQLFSSAQGLMIGRFIAFAYTYHYLNWFSKTSVIRWHEVPRGRLIGCVVAWIGSLALYAYDYRVGILALAFLSLLHVYLEFPLNHRTFVTIGSEIAGWLGGRRRRGALIVFVCFTGVLFPGDSAVVAAQVVPPQGAQDTTPDGIGRPTVRAPFDGLDTLCVDDWWNREASDIIDLRVPRDEVVAFGLYSVQDGVLKLSAQLFPLYPDETRVVRLELMREDAWEEVARASVNDLGWSTLFRVEGWDATRDVPYRLRHGEAALFDGLIRRDPVDKDEIVLAALSCNSNHDRGLRPNYVRNLRHQDPDLLFFAGDQSYDHNQHTAAWLKFGLQFRDLFRDRPCVTIPDDHDIGQSNLWGEGGKVAKLAGGADGGYFHHPEYVRMVERCQTSHLPDAWDPTPVQQGIGVYYTRLVVGGVDFAILEDRKFKSGPAGKIPQQGPRPDHILDPEYDPVSIDVAGLTLLGDRQLAFLRAWGADKEGVAMKAVLSQTGFCGGAHLHGSVDNRLHADLDSNGWPQSGRQAALRLIQAAGAIHVAGDQHLATLIQHGIDDFRDGPWALVVPAIVNDYYGRWWWPEDEAAGENRDPQSALPWTGDYLDGFGNRITMEAYANPESASRGAGYGLVRFDKAAREVTFECWPRDADVSQEGAEQFPGWPRTIEFPAAAR